MFGLGILSLVTVFAGLPARLTGARQDAKDRGDIPGWVMIAIMSAAVVVVLIPLVGSKVGAAFSNAIDSVSGLVRVASDAAPIR